VTATALALKEYDRFGPWIDAVEAPDDVPPLYQDYPIDFSTARVVLKVPRNITRRNATPGMDLYDHLVVLDQESLTVLSRRKAAAKSGEGQGDGPGFDVVSIRLEDVVAIRDAVNLLDGRLTVSTSSGVSVTLPYNGSARGTVTDLVASLRSAVCERQPSRVGLALLAAGAQSATLEGMPDIGPADVVLANRFHDYRGIHPGLTLWAAHGRVSQRPGGTGLHAGARRVAHVVSPMTIHGALVAADSAVVEILGRHAWLVRGRAPIYSTSRLVVSLGALDAVEAAPHPVYPGVTVATFKAGAWSTDVALPAGSAAEQVLSVAAEIGRA